MMILIPGLIIRVGAAALSRGAGAAIARWAGGNIVARTIGTVVADKAIDEARDYITNRAEWEDGFREDPGRAIADTIKDVAGKSAKQLINPLSWREDTNAIYSSTKELVTGEFKPGEGIGEVFMQELREGAIASIGDEVERGVRQIKDPVRFAKEGFDFDLPRSARNYSESILRRGFELTNQASETNQNIPNLETQTEQIEEQVQRKAEDVYQELFYAQSVTKKLLGSDRELENLVQEPAEKATQNAIDAAEE